MLFARLILFEILQRFMKAEEGEFESLAPFYRVCDRRASYHQTVSLDAVQLFQLLELLDKRLFVLV
jgi:hypothetical protein